MSGTICPGCAATKGVRTTVARADEPPSHNRLLRLRRLDNVTIVQATRSPWPFRCAPSVVGHPSPARVPHLILLLGQFR